MKGTAERYGFPISNSSFTWSVDKGVIKMEIPRDEKVRLKKLIHVYEDYVPVIALVCFF